MESGIKLHFSKLAIPLIFSYFVVYLQVALERIALTIQNVVGYFRSSVNSDKDILFLGMLASLISSLVDLPFES